MARKQSKYDAAEITIGKKIREARIMCGLASKQLAAEIGVTHQQLNKYERGVDRISASRLGIIAHALRLPYEFFYDGKVIREVDGHGRICLEISRNIMKLKNNSQRAMVGEFVKQFLASEGNL